MAVDAPHMTAPAQDTQNALTPRDWDLPWKGTFLETLAQMPNVSSAAKVAGISRARVYQERETDTEFALAWKEAVDVSVDLLEQIAHRRATVGEARTVTRRKVKRDKEGAIIEEEEVTEESLHVSDTLAIFLLKAHRPEKFRERIDHRHQGDPEAPIQLEVHRKPTRQRMLELARLSRELPEADFEVAEEDVTEVTDEPE